MPRFVILRHELPASSGRPTHWDFMLEWGTMLRTWALDEMPAVGATIAGVELADHRIEYLDYEGPISGDRGSVRRVERGTYRLIAETPDELAVRLSSERLSCVVRVVCVVRVDTDGQRVSFSFEGTSSATAGGG